MTTPVAVLAAFLLLTAVAEQPRVCITRECKRLAARMLAQMDHETSPCDNFYMYACGGLRADHFLLQYDYSKDVRDRIRGVMRRDDIASVEPFQKFKDFHTSCLNNSGKNLQKWWGDEVVNILNQIGIFDGEHEKWNVNFTTIFTVLLKHNIAPVFDINLDINGNNSSQYILNIITSELNPLDVYTDPKSSCQLRNDTNLNTIYEKCKNSRKVQDRANALNVLEAFDVLNNSESFQMSEKQKLHLKSMLEKFYDTIITVTPPIYFKRQNYISKNYTLITIDELNARHPLVEWNILLRNLIGSDLRGNTSLQLYFQDYFDDVFKIMHQNKSNMVEGLVSYFIQKFYTDIVKKNIDKKHEYCTMLASNFMEEVRVAAYIRSFTSEELVTMRRSVQNAFSQLKDSMSAQFQASKLLDNTSKVHFLGILHNITLDVEWGEQYFRNDTFLAQRLESINVSTIYYVKNIVTLLQWYRRNMYSLYYENPRMSTNMWTFHVLPCDTNGVSLYGLNSIMIPIAVLATPFYNSTYPGYLIMAGLGNTMAHVLARHFDNTGIRFGFKEKLDTTSIFANESEVCFSKQYKNPISLLAEDGRSLTLKLDYNFIREEVFADALAEHVAYGVFKTHNYDAEPQLPFLGLNNKQAFFLHLAQGFCSKDSLRSSATLLFENERLPPLLRLNHIASQSEGFSEAFNCPKNAPLNPEERCKVSPSRVSSSSTTSTPLLITTTEATTKYTELSVKKQCTSKECKRLAARMLAQMDHETSPCDNFYTYACGGLRADHFLLPYDYSKDVRDRIRRVLMATGEESPEHFRKFKTFYDSCLMGDDTLEDALSKWAIEVAAVLRDVQSFDVMLAEELNFTKIFSLFIKYHNPQVFDVLLDVDDNNSSRTIIKITIPLHKNPFTLPEDASSECSKDPEIITNMLNDMYAGYENCMLSPKPNNFLQIMEALKALNASEYFNISEYNAQMISSATDNFYNKNIKILPSKSTQRISILSKTYRSVTVEDLNNEYPMVEWKVLIEDLLQQTVVESTPIQLYFHQYFKEIFQIANEDKVNTYKALLATFVQKLYTYLVLYHHVDEEYCLYAASHVLKDVASAAYISTFSGEELSTMSEVSQQVFAQVKSILEHQLHISDWLDLDSKSFLLFKLHDLSIAVDSAESLYRNNTYLQNSMAMFDSTPEMYTKNALGALLRLRRQMYSNYDVNPRDPRYLWTQIQTPGSTSSVSVYELNMIAVPFALLNEPFYHKSYPKFVVMARLGIMLAHEIAHHFDSIGIQHNSEGRKGSFLSKTAQDYYSGMECCFESLYSFPMTREAETGRNVEFTLNCPLSKNERLANDISAMLIYSILKNSSMHSDSELPFLGMPNDQAFFLLLAQNFCSKESLLSSAISLFEDENLPPFLRVNHIASNSKGFIETFKCPVGFGIISGPSCEVFPGITSESLGMCL